MLTCPFCHSAVEDSRILGKLMHCSCGAKYVFELGEFSDIVEAVMDYLNITHLIVKNSEGKVLYEV